MFHRIWSVCALACLVAPSSLFAQAQENPFKKADVGDWVSYEVTIASDKRPLVSTMKQTLKEKTDKEATVAVEYTSSKGDTIKAPDQKIPLDKPYDTKELLKLYADGQAQKPEEADDTVTIGGKTYKCKRIKLKVMNKLINQETTTTFWISPEVPLSGLLKLETDLKGRKVIMELTGSGKK